MKRKITIGILIFVCFILQCTLFKTLALASISPNLLIIITSSFGFMRGKKNGMAIGFICGLLVDIFYGGVFGFFTLLYMYIGYVNGLFTKIFYPEDVKLPLILISASDLAYNLLIYFFLFLFRSRFDFIYYLLHIILPELVYTILITIILYQLILRLDIWLEESEKKENR